MTSITDVRRRGVCITFCKSCLHKGAASISWESSPRRQALAPCLGFMHSAAQSHSPHETASARIKNTDTDLEVWHARMPPRLLPRCIDVRPACVTSAAYTCCNFQCTYTYALRPLGHAWVPGSPCFSSVKMETGSCEMFA